MGFRFNTRKTIQAAAVLLKQHGGRMSRLRMLKLLYMADRKCIQETLRSITGDTVSAMDHGPVLSRTLDLIEGSDHDAPQWDRVIQRIGPQDHILISDPGNGSLSKREINALIELSQKYRDWNDYALAVETHGYEEYKANRPAPGGSKPIAVAQIFQALGLGDQFSKIVEETKADIEFEHLLRTAERGLPVHG